MKSKSFVLMLSGLLLLIGIIGVVYLKSNQDNTLPENLHRQFKCDRVTKEALTTDKYCNDYNLYKRDHKAGVI
jgi:hypothetical protein